MVKTIDECFFQIQNGANIKQGDVDDGFPITRIETTANDKFNRDRMGYAGITDISKYESYVLEDGDLLMSHINSVQYLGRTVLYVKEADETIIHGMNLLRLKARRNIIDPSYARYCFYGHSFRSKISNITKKSVNQASFAVKDLKQIKIEVPSLSEQDQIVKILDGIQNLIQMRNDELSALDDLIKARFVELFGDPVLNDKKFLTVLGDSFFKLSNGKAVLEKKRYKAGIPAYGGNGISCFTDKPLIADDTLVVGRVGFQSGNVHYAEGPLWITDNAMYISKYDKDKFNLMFLCDLMQHIDFSRFQDAGDLKKITQKPFMNFRYILPSMDLQQQFVDFKRQVDKSKAAVQKALDETQLLFDSLMQEYFG